jgi:DNA-binding response OmpR family regulator
VPVLIFETDRDVCDLMAFALERAGFTALVASDRQAQLREEQPAAVVSGVPSGHRSLRLLQHAGRFNQLPIIEVAKPFRPSELVARVRAKVA